MKSRIHITQVKVRPFDDTSRIASEYPSYDSFDNRNHFLMLSETHSLAVVIDVHNSDYGNTECEATNCNYVVDLIDSFTGKTLASEQFSVCVAPWIQYVYPRVDLHPDFSMILPEHPYTVSVRKKSSRTPLLSRKIMFYNISVMPNKVLKQTAAYIECDGDEKCRHPEYQERFRQMSLVVLFKSPQLWWKMPPELTANLYIASANHVQVKGTVEPVDQDIDIPDVIAYRFMLDDVLFSPGVIYASICLFGYAFTGLVFDHGEHQELGLLREDDFILFPEYYPHMGRSFLESRQKQLAAADPEVLEARQSLKDMVGLATVKRQILDYECLVRFNMMRSDAHLPNSMPPLHSMFCGAPGTGKTTVAKLIGKILHGAGVLSKGHVVVYERATLLGQFYNSEAQKTREAIEAAQGGILFIDEAYQLYQPSDPKDPGRFVLETLMTALADESNRDWMLIMAGYTEPMMRLFNANPGLRSRIPESNIYTFPDYSPSELCDIAHNYFAKNLYTLSPEAEARLCDVLAVDHAMRGIDFGNARHVVNLIQTRILPSMARRIATIDNPTVDDLSQVCVSDIPLPAPVTELKQNRQRVGFAIR